MPEGDSGAEAAYQGVLRIREQLRIPVTIQRSIGSAGLAETLRSLAASDATMIVAYGPEAGLALEKIDSDFPNQRFALVQGQSNAARVATYSVAHEQSAWLAGAAAGLLSRKKIVGHVGNLRNETTAAARGAFYSGLQTALPKARFLSSFVVPGEVANRAKAQIAAGADVIFHTLDDDDTALAAVARQHGVPLIGRGRDWLAQNPGVYAATAIADTGVASFQAGQDLHDGLWKPGRHRKIGVENPKAVRLRLAEKTPEAVQQRVDLYQRELKAGGYSVVTKYDGPEF
ncbi:MAG TPA: BMP family ABC transporter substrate-binding protein [Burkholderiales bacterium]|nr:BMP family ABC transporter substrate-binding protein [Burkholderiales bacterium]